MTQAKHGDTVRIHYTGRLTDGTEFDSSAGREPLEFQLGSGQIITGLDNQVQGMNEGESATVTIPADEAYGQHRAEGVQTVPRERIPEGVDVSPGARLQATGADGRAMTLTVVNSNAEEVTVDANHPLAGKDLVFDVELVEVVNG
ncbi:FKBP-type peptidyl-prolyl cis-trans isomerase [Pelagibacterium xiamenense]|uniref:FKBP-type peptidyl-prolyl cis-trans isomerase n=1 Tax=Pelagibacterium xiamenense TaxID=2901140 RepID=UPI001E5FA57E|nr:peptidylprolyl isomerase [Pelagibacterium xiamenense]MCD7059037.1 peptidylprolyl isomerase [Pelagibacterium xiamenense]